ncbi:MAG: cadherin-like domain-containing protein, partial [Candidatus Thioglobus sp.]|nr:cadherin-like domain-containing protein [Candidatus Thioglobus sp.]
MQSKILFAVCLTLLLAACGGGGGGEGEGGGSNAPALAEGRGSQGPFREGISVVAHQLNPNGTRRSRSVSTTTTDNLGSYALNNIGWSGGTEIVMSGEYLDENDGSTNKTAELSAITKVTSGQSVAVNVNVFTDLAAERIKTLLRQNPSFASAETQANTAIKSLFSLTNEAVLTELDLTQNSADNAELLRISAVTGADASGDLRDKLRAGIADGNLTNSADGAKALADLNTGIAGLNIATIAQNIAALGTHTTAAALGTRLTNLNDAPVITPLAARTVAEDSAALVINLSATDANSAALTFSAISVDASLATVSVTPGAKTGTTTTAILSITPKLNQDSSSTIVITATDSAGGVNAAQFVLTVTPVNDAPAATAQAVTVAEDDSVRITLAAEDVDNDDNRLTYAIATQPTNGSITGSDSSRTYTPNANFNGTDAFAFTAADDNLTSTPATITITVTPVNDAPEGRPSISGDAVIGETITADITSITDADGLGTFSYQWRKNGRNISGATNATLALTHANVSVGERITVVVSYRDDAGKLERPPASAPSTVSLAAATGVMITSSSS